MGFCHFCEGHGGAVKGTNCPVCGLVAIATLADDHLTAPCVYCHGNHAQVYCRAYNRKTGMKPLYGYEV